MRGVNKENTMNPRILGIIGGLALLIALLSHFMMGSSKKVEQLYQSQNVWLDVHAGVSDLSDWRAQRRLPPSDILR